MAKQREIKKEENQLKMSEIDLNILIKFIVTFDFLVPEIDYVLFYIIVVMPLI